MELRKFVYQWLLNEKILGEKTIEIVGTISLDKMDKKTKDRQMDTKDGHLSEGNKHLSEGDKHLSEGDKHLSEGNKHLSEGNRQESMKDRQLGGIDTQKEVRPQITALNKLVLGCKKCDLHTRRNKLVFGNGNPESSIVFIGEAPGREEDESGLPFVGSAGKQLTSMLKSVGIDRDAVYITNIIKCRPPGNRDPLPAEMNSCFEWLDKQLEIIAPKLICTLGKHSTFSLLGHVKPLEFHQTLSISKFRGKIYEYKGIKVVPTYHPAALLYHPEWKEATISDLTMVKKMLDRV